MPTTYLSNEYYIYRCTHTCADAHIHICLHSVQMSEWEVNLFVCFCGFVSWRIMESCKNFYEWNSREFNEPSFSSILICSKLVYVFAFTCVYVYLACMAAQICTYIYHIQTYRHIPLHMYVVGETFHSGIQPQQLTM